MERRIRIRHKNENVCWISFCHALQENAETRTKSKHLLKAKISSRILGYVLWSKTKPREKRGNVKITSDCDLRIRSKF